MTTTKVPQKNYISTEHRFNAALHDVQQSGVLVFDNYPSCCGSCSFAEIEQEHPDTDYIFFHNSQGRALKFIKGVPYNYETDESDDPDEDDGYVADTTQRRATTLWWSHSTIKAAQAAYDAFKRHGFDVEWDGTENNTVCVKFKGD